MYVIVSNASSAQPQRIFLSISFKMRMDVRLSRTLLRYGTHTHTHKKYRSYQSIVFQLLHLDEIRGVGDVCSATLVKIWGGKQMFFFSPPQSEKNCIEFFFFY